MTEPFRVFSRSCPGVSPCRGPAPAGDVDLLVVNASELLTLAGPARPRAGPEMRDNAAIKNGAAALGGGVVIETGDTAEIVRKYRGRNTVDAGGRLVMPGFTDPHTHLVFAGSRENEMALRLNGAAYLDILKSGGGIHATVAATREASSGLLMEWSRGRIGQMLAHGTTTVEVKSGYGLDSAAEEKILDVIGLLRREGPADVIATFLGAHAIPSGAKREDYLDWIVDAAIPRFRDKAEFCDVFCEDGAFTLEESERILRSAKERGYKLKIHAGQFNDLGAVRMAADLGAVSADHLDRVSSEQLEGMREKGMVAVLLPGASFFLGSDAYPDYRRFEAHGVPVALATDFNPGSCPCFSMQMMMALAALKMGMTAEEAVTAATVNAAWAVDRGLSSGSLEPGKQADLIVLDVRTAEQIPYYFGANLVRTVVKRGKVVV
jgi:imidazolonepropionase